MSDQNQNSGVQAASAISMARSASAQVPALPRGLSSLAGRAAAQPTAQAYSPIVLAGLVRGVEFGLVCMIGIAIYGLYVLPAGNAALSVDLHYFATSIAVGVLAIVAFQAADIYHVDAFRSPVGAFARLIIAWTFAFLVLTAFVFLGDFYSRVWLAGFFFVGAISLIGFRLGLFGLVRTWTSQGRLDRRTVIVGGGESGEALIRALHDQRDSDLRVVGLFDDRGEDRAPAICAGQHKLGSVDDLVEFGRRTRVDLVIFSLPISAETRILQMLKKLWVLPVDIRLSAHSNKLQFRPRSYSYIGRVPVLDVADRPIADWDVVIKWLFDKVVGTALLIACAPIMLMVGLAIKLDSKGPIFFKQRCYGFNNELIEVFKFRSMHAAVSDPNAMTLITKGDPILTRVGRFIRKTSLDELPQLINVVFKGNLSLVGPRPHAVHAKAADRLYDEAVDGYFARHRVKPGITGWAQINGWRGETETQDKIQKRVEHDLYYIENWSILLDLTVLAMTPFALAKSETAY